MSRISETAREASKMRNYAARRIRSLLGKEKDNVNVWMSELKILSRRELRDTARRFSASNDCLSDAPEGVAGFNRLLGNKDAAIYWYGRFLENYPKHEWANQAQRALDLLKNMKD